MTVIHYDSFHTNPINKFIHFICIPLIMITTLNLIKRLGNYDKKLILFYILYYYLVGGINIGMVMNIFLIFIYFISCIWREIDKFWYINTIFLFITAWGMQFLGHAIEGNKPAFITGLVQTIFEAPLFVVDYIYPSFLDVFR